MEASLIGPKKGGGSARTGLGKLPLRSCIVEAGSNEVDEAVQVDSLIKPVGVSTQILLVCTSLVAPSGLTLGLYTPGGRPMGSPRGSKGLISSVSLGSDCAAPSEAQESTLVRVDGSSMTAGDSKRARRTACATRVSSPCGQATRKPSRSSSTMSRRQWSERCDWGAGGSRASAASGHAAASSCTSSLAA